MNPVKKLLKERFVYLLFIAVLMLVAGAIFMPINKTNAQKKEPNVYKPKKQQVEIFEPVRIKERSEINELNRTEPLSWVDVIPSPKQAPNEDQKEIPQTTPSGKSIKTTSGKDALAPPNSLTGSSPGPAKTFQGEFLSGGSIPPDTMGAVGINHTFAVSNNQIRITDRNGKQITRMTLNAFWAGLTVNGNPVTSTFDPKVLYDRFNDRYILISSSGSQSPDSAALFAVSQTPDPTGAWTRFTVRSDPTATTAGGIWIDYPSIGINKDWIVINYNSFGFGTSGGSYARADIFVIDKAAAYAGTPTVTAFQELTAGCANGFTNLCSGFTLAPAIVEDNMTETVYLAENYNGTSGILRLSKITGTPATGGPVLTVGIQAPAGLNSWRTSASRIASSGGYAPQRQQVAYLPSGSRLANNDARMGNVVYRNGRLWATHHVMVAATPSAPGVGYNATNPDVRSVIQWWEIDQAQEPGAFLVPALQFGRIEDPIADNCHNGTAGLRTTGTCTSNAAQVGQFFAFPNIAVNKDNDVFIGFTQFSAYAYPSGAYAIRRNADAPNTMRNLAVYRPGQANYGLASGTGTSTHRRWGDYSAAMTDPVNDTDFWAVQEFSGVPKDFGIGITSPWETFWAYVIPSDPQPVTNGNLIISEFRLNGPQGVRDEFVELYNPGTSPVIVNTTDNSDGWALAYSADGTAVTPVTVVPNGTVIPARGHFLITSNPIGGTTPILPTTTYSLSNYPSQVDVRGADGDTGYTAATDLADNGGFAIFKTSTVANFSAATRMDSVGFSTIAAGLFKEGAGIPAITTQPTADWSYLRNLNADTQDNNADFIFVSTDGASPSAGVQRVGSPGPQNLGSPIANNAQLPISLIDSTVAADAAPNQFYDATATGPNAANGTVQVRRSVLNNTGELVTRLRFRITSLSTNPDLRLLSSSDIAVTSSDATVCGTTPVPCNITAKALILENVPTLSMGGGVGSSVAAGEITFAAPLNLNARYNVNFLFGVQSGTPFKSVRSLAPQAPVAFTVNVEALTQPSLAPSAALAVVKGRVTTAKGQGISRIVVVMTNEDGKEISATTNSFGYFTINDVQAGETYIFNVKSRTAKFTPQIVQVVDNISDLIFVARGR